MTSSYGTVLSRSTDRPEPNSRTNYAEFETTQNSSLDEAVNKEIDRQTQEYQKQSQDLIAYYKQTERNKANQYKNFIDTVKTGAQVGVQLKDFIESENEIRDLRKKLQSGELDDDIERVNQGEARTKANEVEGLILGKEIDESNGDYQDSYNAKTLFDYTNQYGSDKRTAKSAMDNYYPIFRAEASAVEFQMPDGERMLSLNNATDPKDVAWLNDRINSIFYRGMKDLGYGRGFMKKYVLRPMLEQEKTFMKSKVEALATAAKTKAEEISRNNFIDDVKDDPQALIDFIGTQYGYMGRSWKAARDKAFSYLIEAVKTGDLTYQDVQNILNHQFEGHDFNLKKVRDYWGKEASTLLDAALKEEGKRGREKKLEQQGRQSLFVDNAFKEWEGKQITEQMVKDKIEVYKKEWPGQEVNERLQTALTNAEGGDAERVAILEYKERKQLPILETDVMFINDHETWRKWKVKVGTGMDESDTDYRDNFVIKPMVTQYRGDENFEKTGVRSPAYQANVFNATLAYNKEYSKVMGLTGDKNEARTAATTKVTELYEKYRDTTWKVLPNTPVNRPLADAVQSARVIIQGDRSAFINNKTFNPGEEPYLQAGLKALQEGKAVPMYYVQLTGSNGLIMHPRELIERRLIATGLAKEGDFKPLPERNLNKIENQKALLSHTSSEGVAYRIANDTDEDIAVILDALSHNPVNGYDTIKNSNGTIAELDKPLSQHTLGEVLALVEQGYDNFGMYDLSRRGLLETLQSNSHGLSLDTMFDQQTQDALVLARMRYKVNRQSQFTGADPSYRRLVSISPELETQFNELIGDIQNAPFMQLKNMLPDVATAYVEENIQ